MTTWLALLLATAPDAAACGQSTHVWIGIEALQWLPDGELRTLLEDPALFDHRVLGAQFPDGGYSPISRDPYGETAHWPPFQDTYLAWIRETYDPPYTGEAAEHVAFLMGLAAHGMADQVFDGVYLTRSLLYDGPEVQSDVDTTTDIGMVGIAGPMPLVADVAPYDTLVEVFDRYGQPADASVMKTGVASLFIAVDYIGRVGSDEARVAEVNAQLPWTVPNLDNPAIACSPACIQEVVAAYWLTLWERLHDGGEGSPAPVFWTWPEDGSYGHPREALDIESQVSLAFRRAIDISSLPSGAITVTAEDGTAHPVSHSFYYGDRSNVVNLSPEGDWDADTTYTVTVPAGVRAWDGSSASTEPWTFSFSTIEAPPRSEGDLDSVDDDADARCGCHATTAPWTIWPWVALLAWRRRPRASVVVG